MFGQAAFVDPYSSTDLKKERKKNGLHVSHCETFDLASRALRACRLVSLQGNLKKFEEVCKARGWKYILEEGKLFYTMTIVTTHVSIVKLQTQDKILVK